MKSLQERITSFSKGLAAGAYPDPEHKAYRMNRHMVTLELPKISRTIDELMIASVKADRVDSQDPVPWE